MLKTHPHKPYLEQEVVTLRGRHVSSLAGNCSAPR